jgi:ADP-ribose pyrophosphatase YjhB (NUDIX family)
MKESDFSVFSDRGLFLVNSLGIIFNPKTKMVLIGRRVNDPLIKELTWCFPGGRPSFGRSLEKSLIDEIKKKTGLKKVKVNELIFARVPSENERFLLLYYFCVTNESKIVAGEKFAEVKWVKPKDCIKCFKTSVSPRIKKFMALL